MHRSSSRHAQTPWGGEIDYRVPQVRAFAIENALHWLSQYRFDGLRLDAVHAIAEPGEPSMIAELSRVVGGFAAATGRQIHLVLENDDNRAQPARSATDPPSGKYRAQWNDDYHHAWHVLLTGESRRLLRRLRAAIRSPGLRARCRPVSPIRAMRRRIVAAVRAASHRGTLPPLLSSTFLQNHDQIGNRPLGDRLEALADPAAIEAALAVTLLAPMPPLLFMGEEWGSRQPFPFFCDFQGDLAEAVRNGRREEFEAAYAESRRRDARPADGGDIPERRSSIGMRARRRAAAGGSHWCASLLAVRRQEIVPLLRDVAFARARMSTATVLSRSWRLDGGRSLHAAAPICPAKLQRRACQVRTRRARSGATQAATISAAVGGVLDVWERDDAARHPARDLSLAVHRASSASTPRPRWCRT